MIRATPSSAQSGATMRAAAFSSSAPFAMATLHPTALSMSRSLVWSPNAMTSDIRMPRASASHRSAALLPIPGDMISRLRQEELLPVTPSAAIASRTRAISAVSSVWASSLYTFFRPSRSKAARSSTTSVRSRLPRFSTIMVDRRLSARVFRQ